MHNGRLIDLGDALEDACAQCSPALDLDASQERAGHLAEKRLHQIKLGTVRGCVDVDETIRPRRQIGHRLIGDVGRVIAEQQRRIVSSGG